jgi:hypothetical protein
MVSRFAVAGAQRHRATSGDIRGGCDRGAASRETHDAVSRHAVPHRSTAGGRWYGRASRKASAALGRARAAFGGVSLRA